MLFRVTAASTLLSIHTAAWSCNDEGATEVLKRMPLANVDPQAVCNDGTEASYYLKDNGNPSLWLIYLAGGGWCYDATSCTARFNGSAYPHHDCSKSSAAAPCFGSSKDYTETCGKTGVFDANFSPLASANKVYVPYCSSDGHMGDGEFGGWQFRGARIARAVIKDLRSQGLQQAKTVVFGGGSAGGRGAMVLLDEVAESLRPAKVLGFLDSPLYIDIPSLSEAFAGFQPQHVAVLENFGAASVVGADCAAVHGHEMWKCLFGEYRMPFVRTPHLLMAAQFDGWQLSHLVHGYDGIEKDPAFTADELAYVEAFGNRTFELAEKFSQREGQGSLVYSTACYNHHITGKPGFFDVRTSNGVSESDATSMWLQGPVVQSLIDECKGYACGSGCDAQSLAVL